MIAVNEKLIFLTMWIDDHKNSGIIKIFVPVFFWDTVSVIIVLAHVTQDPFSGTLRPSTLQFIEPKKLSRWTVRSRTWGSPT